MAMIVGGCGVLARRMGLEDAVAWERAMWWELDALGGKTWKEGVKQFRNEKSYRPGPGAYKWKK